MSAFVVDIHDLAESGGSKQVSVSEPLDGLDTDLACVPADRPVHVDVLLESVDEGVLARGTVTGRYTATCRRCLSETDVPFDVDVAEVFRPGTDVWEEGYVVREGKVDLRPALQDSVLLAMPYNPVCSPDCAGLCPTCGTNLNAGECDCVPEEPPDRWAALRALLDR